MCIKPACRVVCVHNYIVLEIRDKNKDIKKDYSEDIDQGERE